MKTEAVSVCIHVCRIPGVRPGPQRKQGRLREGQEATNRRILRVSGRIRWDDPVIRVVTTAEEDANERFVAGPGRLRHGCVYETQIANRVGQCPGADRGTRSPANEIATSLMRR